MNDNPTLAELNEMLAEELARHDLNIVSCAIISGLMNDVTARAEAAEARVAELEAQLAARQWRPVTESPHQTGEYIGYDGNIVRCVSYNSDWDSDDDWPWSDIDGIFTPVEMWRPLPPAPQEPTP